MYNLGCRRPIVVRNSFNASALHKRQRTALI